MVHALTESWRILVPGGKLLDLRPRSGTYPIDMATPTERFHVGDFDGHGAASDDAAADAAVRNLVTDGSLIPPRDTYFDIEFYWDTVSEMESHVETNRRITSLNRSYGDLEKLYLDLSTKYGEIRLCYYRPTMLAVYRKAESRPPTKSKNPPPQNRSEAQASAIS